MKMYNLKLYFVDGSNFAISIDEAELNNLKSAIKERGFNVTFLISDGAINLSQICHLNWEEQ